MENDMDVYVDDQTFNYIKAYLAMVIFVRMAMNDPIEISMDEVKDVIA